MTFWVHSIAKLSESTRIRLKFRKPTSTNRGKEDEKRPFGAKGDLGQRNVSPERVQSVARDRRGFVEIRLKNPLGCRGKGRIWRRPEDLRGKSVPQNLRQNVGGVGSVVDRRLWLWLSRRGEICWFGFLDEACDGLFGFLEEVCPLCAC